MTFDSLGLPNALVKALSKEGYTKPYPIQSQAIPAILDEKDVLGIAKTGSGKTASYVLPILANLQNKPEPKNRHIQALVLVPTRELTVQVFETFKLFSSALCSPIKSLAVFGGASINPQMIQMQGVRILIATPGRLIELKESNAMNLGEVDVFVLDEADKMLNLGFKEEMDKILSFLPKQRQNLLFSATLNKEIDGINRLILKQPVEIKIEEEKDAIDLIDQSAYLVLDEQKGPILRYLIKSQELKQVLIFTSTVYKADQVAEKLTKNGIEAQATHSKKSQRARTVALADFKSGKLRVLVATDLLSRGIDIEFLPVVINYELPRSPKDFIHRIGRTGRAESPGKAITFVTKDELHHFKVIQKKMGKWIKLTYTDDLDLHGF
ncbi:DEAD/DEAH box helicase [Salibacteraceae bacterium]|nr:DEAD/DEAH box helicase [Salibacteraceae bacterium]